MTAMLPRSPKSRQLRRKYRTRRVKSQVAASHYGIAGASLYVEPGLPVKNAMFPTKINDLHATAASFLHSHRDCLVEITFSGLACTYAEDGGVLSSIELGTKPGGNVDLYIVLRNSDGSRAVKTVRNVRSLDTTGRVLSVASETGVQENLECVGLHDAAGREKVLLIRHLAEMGQA